MTFDQGATTGSTQNASIVIIDDPLVEGTESFVVSGSVTAPVSFVAGGNMVIVSILDNDGECGLTSGKRLLKDKDSLITSSSKHEPLRTPIKMSTC